MTGCRMTPVRLLGTQCLPRYARWMRTSYVYAIRFGEYVKIGCTVQPRQRLRQLSRPSKSTRSPADLSYDDIRPLFAVAGDLHTERVLHVLFSDEHVIGEWYSWSPRFEVWVTALPAMYIQIFMPPSPPPMFTGDDWGDDYRGDPDSPPIPIPVNF